MHSLKRSGLYEVGLSSSRIITQPVQLVQAEAPERELNRAVDSARDPKTRRHAHAWHVDVDRRERNLNSRHGDVHVHVWKLDSWNYDPAAGLRADQRARE